MSNVTINQLPIANSIDPTQDYLPIYTASATATQGINRNTLLGLASAPVGLTDSQTLTSKTLTSPTISGPTLSGTLAGTYTIGGTPTFPSSVVQLTSTQTLTNKTLTSPTINTPTITNATISADTLTGYTTSNSGTVYGISVSSGTIGSAALAAGAVEPVALMSGTGTTWVTQTWSPTLTGFSANPTGALYYYIQVGKMVSLFISMPNNGTSNSTGFTISLPVTARTLANANWCGMAQVVDNGTAPTTPGLIYIVSAGTTLTVFKDWAADVFTASGNKRVAFGTITYEAA